LEEGIVVAAEQHFVGGHRASGQVWLTEKVYTLCLHTAK
jgi:hypothetical protein